MNERAPSGLSVAAFGVIGVALVGVVAGTREGSYVARRPVAEVAASDGTEREADDAQARPARSYTELMIRPWGAEPSQRPALTRVLRSGEHGRVPASVPEARAQALDARAAHRAFSGAPPTIPHPIEPGNGSGCPACHLEGGMFGDVLVPPMSHGFRAQCTQCHVAEHAAVPRSEDTFRMASNFVPLRGAPAPSRWSMAPPQTPHTLLMRERCASCHGAYGRHGLQTSHPERRACLQCHAPPAVVNQLPDLP